MESDQYIKRIMIAFVDQSLLL